MASMRGREFYRYVSEEEVESIRSTGLLRGGRPGETFWTEDYYESVRQAQSRLALRQAPGKRVRFRILNEPAMERENTQVRADEGQPGGGTEYMSAADEQVEVEVIEVEDLD